MRYLFVAVGILAGLWSATPALAQPLYNPLAANPYSRPWLTPYLNLTNSGTAANTFYRGVLEERALRNEQLRPFFGPDLVTPIEPWRSMAYQSVTGYQSAEDWVSQRIRETQLSSSGHPAGFLIANPYYRMPNQRSFVPFNQGMGQPQPR
jgi:hypothetical protein